MAEVSNHWKPAMPVYLLFSKAWKQAEPAPNMFSNAWNFSSNFFQPLEELVGEPTEAVGGLRRGTKRKTFPGRRWNELLKLRVIPKRLEPLISA